MAYVKRYPGGFVDLPSTTTAIDSTFLNAVEAALLKLLGSDPAVDNVGVWSAAGGGAFVFQKITASQISATAAIAKTQLAALGIVDADVANAAAIAYSKLALAGSIQNADVSGAAAIAYSKLNLAASIARGDMAAGFKTTVGTWAAGPPGSPTTNDVWIATDVDGAGTCWTFRYNSAEATYKWENIGAVPVLASDGSGFVIAGTSTWTSKATFVAGRAGDYRAWGSFYGICGAGGGGTFQFGYGVNGANVATGGATASPVSVGFNTVGIPWTINAPVAGQNINMMYWANAAGTGGVLSGAIVPVRII